MPSLISSRQIAGHPIAAATRCASVVFPVPGGPLTTTSIGFEGTAAPYLPCDRELSEPLVSVCPDVAGLAAVRGVTVDR